MKVNFRSVAFTPTLLFFLLAGNIAQAQITNSLTVDTSGADASIDEVVITAGRKIEQINQIPSSVTIISEKQLKEQLTFTTDLAQIVGNLVPGLTVSNNKSTNSGQTLRGRTVLVLVEGIPQSTPLLNGARDIKTLDPSVIERIEVIKGATSIYGTVPAPGLSIILQKRISAIMLFRV